MEELYAWWAARTRRERLLMRGGAVFVLGVLAPVWLCFAVYEYRVEAAARVADARDIATKVQRIAAAGPARSGGDGASGLREEILTAAQAQGLTAARIEEAGPGVMRIAFEPADSLAVYRWIDSVGHAGGDVARSSILRVSGGELVAAEFEVRGSR